MNDDMTQKLLALMANPKGSNGTPNEAMLSELFGDDPRVQMIAQYLSKSQTDAGEDDLALDAEDDLLEQAGEEEPGYDDAPTTAEELGLPSLLHALEELSAENAELNTRNAVLTEWVDTLAMALGYCHRCWGDDDTCRVCAGRGQPGWRLPERKLFNEFVAPAIRRWRRQLETRHRPTPRNKAAQSNTDDEHLATVRTEP